MAESAIDGWGTGRRVVAAAVLMVTLMLGAADGAARNLLVAPLSPPPGGALACEDALTRRWLELLEGHLAGAGHTVVNPGLSMPAAAGQVPRCLPENKQLDLARQLRNPPVGGLVMTALRVDRRAGGGLDRVEIEAPIVVYDLRTNGTFRDTMRPNQVTMVRSNCTGACYDGVVADALRGMLPATTAAISGQLRGGGYSYTVTLSRFAPAEFDRLEQNLAQHVPGFRNRTLLERTDSLRRYWYETNDDAEAVGRILDEALRQLGARASVKHDSGTFAVEKILQKP